MVLSLPENDAPSSDTADESTRSDRSMTRRPTSRGVKMDGSVVENTSSDRSEDPEVEVRLSWSGDSQKNNKNMHLITFKHDYYDKEESSTAGSIPFDERQDEAAPDMEGFPEAARDQKSFKDDKGKDSDDDDRVLGVPKKLCLALNIAVLFGIILAVLLSTRNRGGEETTSPGAAPSEEGGGPSTQPTNDVTELQSMMPSISPSTEGPSTIAPTLSRELQFASYLLSAEGGVEYYQSLNSTSPQHNAIEWLSNRDERLLPPSDSDQTQERYALAVFYYSAMGQQWDHNNNWLSGDSVCKWYGVFCDNDDQHVDDGDRHVVILELSSNRVGGSFPIELERLTMLSSLNLGFNLYGQKFPTELGTLTSLQYLSLYFNDFTGTIPTEIGHLSELTALDVSFNSLTGTIPTEIGALSLLTDLSLGFNSFSGSIPSEIGMLSSLPLLSLDYNSFTGTLPSEIGQLTELDIVNIIGNSFTGSLPSEIGLLKNLTELSISSNSFSGSIPSELGQLTELLWLDASSNQMDGRIPSHFGNMKKLLQLQLADNDFRRRLPSAIGLMTSLTALDLSENAFTGSVPIELDNLVNLQRIFLQGNGFVTGLDGLFCNLTDLIVFQSDCGGANPEITCPCCTICSE
eukprot:scaffold1376_cov125-Cylindrotheca_fusiformis.AAC.2